MQEATGENGRIVVDADSVIIERNWQAALQGNGRSVEFLRADVTGVYMREAGFFRGYLKFLFAADPAPRGGLLDATGDPYAVYFTKRQQPEFAAIADLFQVAQPAEPEPAVVGGGPTPAAANGSRPTILFLSADPGAHIKVAQMGQTPLGQLALQIDREARDIQGELRLSPHGREFELVLQPAVRMEDLWRVFLEERPTVVHFSGHGETEGIVLEGPGGAPVLADGQGLAAIFAASPPGRGAKVVVLNSCFSLAQAESIVTAVDVVIGMNHAIDDNAALAFARAFYGTLGHKETVGNAFNNAVANVALVNLPEAYKPVMLVRPGVDPGQLRLI